MPNQKSLYTFNFLQSHMHRVGDDCTGRLPLFDEPVNKNIDTEYWLFSDLYNIFGYSYMGAHQNITDTIRSTIKFSDFQKLPIKNSENVLRAPDFYNFYTGHATLIVNNYDIGGPNGIIRKQNGPDAKLTRYACWSIMKQWSNMIFPQLYFIMPNTEFNTLYDAAYKFSRIHQRDELARAEKTVNGIAYRNNANMRQFNAAMHRAFFYTTDLDSIKDAYDIHGTIFDYMGARSLMARQNALNEAIQKFNTNPKMSFRTFSDILYQELVNSRVKMIRNTNRSPENDISHKSISKLSRELKGMEQVFINKYAFQSLR